MQKKNENLLEKLVKRDYNNELEKILEKKTYSENVKSILLSILYKLEISYKDYKHIKKEVLKKEELIGNIIKVIKNNCDEIKLIKPNSKESEIIGNRTFLVEKKKKRIICYNVERKLLYCLAKICKKNKIIKDNYYIINKTLSNLINVGACINEVEPLRDFNGYSWTTISKEIESITHNLIYQNLIFLVGNDFMNKWVYNKESIMDYMQIFKERLEKLYGKEMAKEIIKLLEEISVYIEMKFDRKAKEKMLNEKEKVEDELIKIQDSEKFVEKITEEKRIITEEIRLIDETINNKHLLEQEYERRNEELALEEKIFSMRILSKMMVEERNEKLQKLEKLNNMLNPQKFVKYKKELETKIKYLKFSDSNDIDKEIEELKLKIQKLFIKCFDIKIEKCNSKQEMIKLMYEFRYYLMIPYNNKNNILEEKNLQKEIEEEIKKVLEKAHKLKVIEEFSKQEEINYELLKVIFENRNLNIEDIEIKLIREREKEKNINKNNIKNKNISKEEYYIQIFDGNGIGEKRKMKNSKIMNKKDLAIRFNVKVKPFC